MPQMCTMLAGLTLFSFAKCVRALGGCTAMHSVQPKLCVDVFVHVGFVFIFIYSTSSDTTRVYAFISHLFSHANFTNHTQAHISERK